MSSINIEKMLSERRRKELLMNSNYRQEAIATFSLSTSSIAHQMNKAIEIRKFMDSSESFVEIDHFINFCEKDIRNIFKQTFGHELISEDFITGNKLMDGRPSELELKMETENQLRERLIDNLPTNALEVLECSILTAVEDASMISDISLDNELYILTIKVGPDLTNTRHDLSDEEKDKIRGRVSMATDIEYINEET